jgi:signal transduction histidine kinase
MHGFLRGYRRIGRRLAARVAGWSAARKSALAIAALFLTASGLAVAYVVNSLRVQTLHDAVTSADRALARNLAIHAYFNQELRPAVERVAGVASDRAFDPAWQSSTYAVRRINAHYRHLADSVDVAGLEYKEAAINARSPENEADADERAFLARAAVDPALRSWSGVRTIDGKDYLVVMRRGETIERSCLVCHGDPAAAPAEVLETFGAMRSFGRADGELSSAITIRVPLSSAYGSATRLALRLSTFVLVVLAATLGLLYLLQRRFYTVPLHTLAAQARALAQGPRVVLAARLPRARELRAVTRLFNTAARTVARRDELLERAVQDGTRALDETQQRLAMADRLATVGTMASGVAHEINNPLAYVLANVAYLAEELRLPEAAAAPRHELLHAALDAVGGAERVRAVVQGLQSFARARPAALAPLDVAPELRAALEMCRRELEPRAVLDVQIAGGLPPIRARAHELRQVFLHLLGNAAHALPPRTREENTIAVEARRSGPHVVVEVRDNGVGIQPDVLPRVFDPFFTTKPVGQGTGLGLSISYGIVRRSGGVIEADSEVGRGSTFRVLLPVAQPTSGGEQERSLSEEPGEGRAASRILAEAGG